MDQSKSPILDALAEYRRADRYGFTPPGHRQGRGTDDRVIAVLGKDPILRRGAGQWGAEAGMNLPDAADATAQSFRVVR